MRELALAEVRRHVRCASYCIVLPVQCALAPACWLPAAPHLFSHALIPCTAAPQALEKHFQSISLPMQRAERAAAAEADKPAVAAAAAKAAKKAAERAEPPRRSGRATQQVRRGRAGWQGACREAAFERCCSGWRLSAPSSRPPTQPQVEFFEPSSKAAKEEDSVSGLTAAAGLPEEGCTLTDLLAAWAS